MYKNYEDKLNTILSNAKGEKVELSNINELDSLIKKARNVEGEMVDKYLDAKKFAQASITSAKLHLKNLNEISSILNNVKNQAKDLGIPLKDIKPYVKGVDFTNGYPPNATKKLIQALESIK
tara:strand:- start:53 stop:418 length:366 start_codon:yes stop_codon:yes gene_type:complete